jgi:ATP-dependent exoDNAse (exonuclease V) alpha subunit
LKATGNRIDTSILNGDQRAAFARLVKYVRDPKDGSVYVLKGWAGTGKTFCISFFINYLLNELYEDKAWYKIAVTGPTNKSVRVIKKSTGIYNHRVSFLTIHKLLGLKEKITGDGIQEFVNDPTQPSKITKIKLLIIDEVSMLNDELFEQVIKKRDDIKIICMGDPAQIPPVGKADCIPFQTELAEEYDITTLELRTVMRQKLDNPIISSSVKIRNNVTEADPGIDPVSIVNDSGEGIEFINLNNPADRKSISEIVARYFKSSQFEEDSEYSKIIAWRNKTVATMNTMVRRTIYGEDLISSKILNGEKLIANNPYIVMGTVVFNTNDEFTVESFKIRTKKFRVEDVEEHIKFYEASVWYLDDNDTKQVEVIEILHEDSEYEFTKLANILKRIAIQKKGKDKSWIDYYDFIREFADVNYAYCITAHKSQGSTYEVSLVMEDDIDMNWDVVERNRIKYTSYTRAKKKLYVLKRF